MQNKNKKGTNLKFPRRNGIEGIPVGRGKGQDARVSAAIVSRGYGIELLLSSSVPEHQPHVLSVNSGNFQIKIITAPMD